MRKKRICKAASYWATQIDPTSYVESGVITMGQVFPAPSSRPRIYPLTSKVVSANLYLYYVAVRNIVR